MTIWPSGAMKQLHDSGYHAGAVSVIGLTMWPLRRTWCRRSPARIPVTEMIKETISA
jgi:hypothetical protein